MRSSHGSKGVKKTYTRGMSLAEYGLILGLVVIVAIPGLTLLGNNASTGINNVAQNNQLSQLPNILTANPVNGGGLANTNVRGTLSNVNESATPIINGNGFNVQYGADGQVSFKSNNGTNTTAVEGSQMMEMVLAQLQQLENSPTTSLTKEEKDSLQKLIVKTSALKDSQIHLEEFSQTSNQKGSIQSNYENSVDNTIDIAKLAQDDFSNKPEILALAKTVVTISNQNYLSNTAYLSQIPPGKLRDMMPNDPKSVNLINRMLLDNVSTTANSNDTRRARDQMVDIQQGQTAAKL